MAVPVPRTYVAAEFETATILNGDIRDTFNFLLAPPRVSVYKSASQSITDNTNTLLTWNLELYDPYATPAHDNATNNSRLVAAETGLYLVKHKLVWGASVTGQRQWQYRLNAAGSPTGGALVASIAEDSTSSTIGKRQWNAQDVPLTAGDYLELFGFQTSGGALNVIGGGSEDSFFQMMWQAKQ